MGIVGSSRHWIGLLAALVLFPGPGSRPPRDTVKIRILFTGNTLGYIEPCDCSAGLLGGLDHRAAAIARASAGRDPVWLIDVGNLYEIPTGPTTELGKRQAAFLSQEMGRLSYDLVAIGPKDLRMEPALMAEDLPKIGPVPLLTNRAPQADLGFDTVPVVRMEIEGLTIDFLDIVGGVAGVPEGLLAPWEEALEAALKASAEGPDRADLQVVIAHVPFRTAEALPLRFPEIDLLFDGDIILPRQAMRIHDTVVISGAGKGQQLGRLDLTVAPLDAPERGGRTGIIGFQGLHIPLPPESPADTDVTARMKAFHDALVRDGLILP